MMVPPLSPKHLYPSPFSSPASLHGGNSCTLEFGCRPYSQKNPGLSLCSQAAVNLQRPTPRKEGLIFFRCPWAGNCMVPPAHRSVVASLHKVTESRVGKSQPTIGSNLTLPCSPGYSALHCFLYLSYDSTLPLFSLSGNFPLCHLVLVLPSPFSFICYP